MRKIFKFFVFLLLITFLIIPGFNVLKIVKAATYTVESSALINTASIKIRPLPSEITGASMQYRKQGDIAWKNAQDPIIAVANDRLEQGYFFLDVVDLNRGAMIKRAHGSIFDLTASTAYEIKVELKNVSGTIIDTVNQTVTTKPDAVTYGSGNTLQVNTTGSGGAYTNIGTAITAANAGDIIEVAAGTYLQSIVVNKSGTQGNPITIRGLNGAILDTDGVSTPGNRPIVVNDGIHDIIIEGFTVKGLHGGVVNRNAHIYMVGTNISRITIQNNRFETSADISGADGLIFRMSNNAPPPVLSSPQIAPFGLTDIIIQNNTVDVKGLGTSGKILYLDGGKNIIIRNNNFKVTTTEDIIAIREGPHENIDIYNNTIEGTPSDDGIELEGGVNINVKVWGNTINNATGGKATISLAPVVVGPTYIFKNTIYGSVQALKVASDYVISAIETQGYNLADFGPIFILQNTFFHPNANAEFIRYETTLCHARLIIKNNLVWNRSLTSSVGTNIQRPARDRYWGDITSNYNLWWKGAGTVNNNAGAGLDANSVFSDPQLVSTSWPNPDLNLQSGSPAIDKGVVLANINDGYSGSAPDLGAYEYAQAPAQPIVTLTKSADKTSAVAGDTITYAINYLNSVAGAQNAVITDAIPNGTTYVSGSGKLNGAIKTDVSDSDEFIFNSGTATWNLGNLATGASGNVSFQAKVN